MAPNTDEDTEPIVQAPSSVHTRKGVGGANLGLAVGFVFSSRQLTMIDLAEDIVAIWLEIQGYFLIRNVKYGTNQEIDILAMNSKGDKMHVEVQVSSNPLAILSHGVNLSDKSFKEGGRRYFSKKFDNDKVKQITGKYFGDTYSKCLVLGNFKSQENIDELARLGVSIIPFSKVISDLRSKTFGDTRVVLADRYRQVLSFLINE